MKNTKQEGEKMAKTWTIKFFDAGHFQYSQNMDNLKAVESMLKEEGFSYSHKDKYNARVYKNNGQMAYVLEKGGN